MSQLKRFEDPTINWRVREWVIRFLSTSDVDRLTSSRIFVADHAALSIVDMVRGNPRDAVQVDVIEFDTVDLAISIARMLIEERAEHDLTRGSIRRAVLDERDAWKWQLRVEQESNPLNGAFWRTCWQRFLCRWMPWKRPIHKG